MFEAFAGIGAQASALSRMNINYEIVGISDWYVDAIECYAAIHCSNVKVDMPTDIKEIDEYLSKYTFSATSVKETKLKLLTEDQRRDLYRANIQSKNYGSITELKGEDMPETDLLVYSLVDEEEFRKCEKALSKIDKKDFSSTRYRYPFTKQDASISLEPIDVRFNGRAPDISSGIPVLVMNGQKVGVIEKGKRLIADTKEIFDVVECLFGYFEANV